MHRNVVAVALTSMITGFAGSLFWTVFNLYLWDLNYTLLEISVLNIIPTSLSLVSSRFFGCWADVSGRKNFIVVGTSILSLAYFLFFLMIKTNIANYAYFIILFGMLGLAGSISSGALLAVTTTMMERRKSGTSFGAYLSVSAIGWTLGSFLSGYLADLYGMAFISLITAIMDILGAAIFGFIFVEETKQRSFSLREIFRDSWRLLVAGDVRALTLVYSITAIFALGSSIYNLAFSIKIYVLFGSKTAFGFIMGLAGISNIISPYIAGRIADRTSKEKLLLEGILARDLYMAYLAVAWDKIATIVFMIIPFWVFIHVPTVSATTDYSARGHESEIQSLRSIVANLSNMIGTLISGIVARIFDVRHNIAAIDIVLIIGAAVYFMALIPATKLYKQRKQHLRMALYPQQ